jgi:Zn-dependent peptidase ImmA (M78 family)
LVKLYAGIDVVVKKVPMPRKLKGFLLEDRGLYCIYVNSEISEEEQRKAIEHEICHLTRDDFCTDEDIEDVERRM